MPKPDPNCPMCQGTGIYYKRWPLPFVSLVEFPAIDVRHNRRDEAHLMPQCIEIRRCSCITDRGDEKFAQRAGPNDYFEISSNNTPDPPDDDDTVIEPQDYAGDYPLEGEDGDDC